MSWITTGLGVPRVVRGVEEAKADSDWDGSIDLMCDQTPQERDICQTLEGMFNAVGFTTNTDYRRDKAVQVWSQRNFEVAVTAEGKSDTGLASLIRNNYGSASKTNPTGYSNPSADTAIEDFNAAATTEARREAMADLQRALDEDPPMTTIAHQVTVTAWNENVTGVEPTGSITVYFDKVVVTE